MAGINAVLKLRGDAPLILDRSQAYIGDLLDDLITKEAREPYRMFTSRAEYRLLLRQDNADLRLTDIGHQLGLVADRVYARAQAKRSIIDEELSRLKETRPTWTEAVRNKFAAMELEGVTPDLTLAQLLKRPELSYEKLCGMLGEPGIADGEIVECIDITVKYDGYIRRQLQQVARFKKLEERQIPAAFNYDRVTGFSREVLEKLKQVRPASIGQASRISGVTPAAVSLLLVALERDRRQAHAHVVASRSTMQ
jgi:tRNA uridine 5-carboxymethylaminomethyl modification enzyme